MPYFTISRSFLLPSFDLPDEERGKLDAFLDILEKSGVGKIIEAATAQETSLGGREPYNPYRLFAAIAYGFCKHSGSVRKIEESVDFDLRFIYLMEQERPSYVTVSKFINNVVVKHQREIYSSIVGEVVRRFSVDVGDAFVDGTKFEANANKYKFVWKPRTFHSWLNAKILALLSPHFQIPPGKKAFLAKEVGGYLTEMGERLKAQGTDPGAIARGKGRRLSPLEKDYLLLQSYMMKALEYEEKEEICGPARNSYFKTDPAATAMCLKADYYSGLGSDMHAAYNIQILVSKGLIIDYMASQEVSDFYTFIPFLDQFKAGAEYSDGSRHPRAKGNKFYIVRGCLRCPLKKVCGAALKRKIKDSRVFEANAEMCSYKKEVRLNLLSAKGIEMRINRSSQVEGGFGMIKQDMSYDRIRRRGLEKVSAEIMLVCLGHLLRKVFGLLDGTGSIDYWKAPEGLKAETMAKPDFKKYLKRKKKAVGKNESIRKGYKYKEKKRSH